MTRKEAIEQLQNCKDLIKQDGQDYLDERDFPLLDMAIEALSKPNYESDTEVRLAVTNRNKDMVVLWDAFGEVEYYPKADRPHGAWIKHKWAEEFDGLLISNYECTNCHSWERNNTDFCPNCGADMRKENK